MRILSSKRHHNRITLIYDASSPIGKATVNNFAKKGSHIILASPDENAILNLEKDLQTYRSGIISVPTDITDPKSLNNLIEQSLKHFARIDHLVYTNIRNISHLARPHDMNNLQETMDTNFYSVINLIDEIVPGMIERRTGHIIFLSSYQLFKNMPNYTAHAASEFALLGYLGSLRREIIKSGIKITVINLMRWKPMKNTGAQIPWFIPSISTDRIASAITNTISQNKLLLLNYILPN
jgi:NADP-dependent 3-hydroxy acid dehydrogenase YdfG